MVLQAGVGTDFLRCRDRVCHLFQSLNAFNVVHARHEDIGDEKMDLGFVVDF